MNYFSIASLLLVAACRLVAQPAPAIPVVACSYDMEALVLLWEENLQQKVPKFKLDLQPGSAKEVAKALIDGRSLMIPINRELKPEELAAFKAKWGYPPTRLAIGVDALVVLVQKDNPIPDLRMEDLSAVWTTAPRPEGARPIQTWGDLGLTDKAWKNRPIACFNRPEGDGLRDYFEQRVTNHAKYREDIQQTTDGMTLIEGLLSNQTAIGYGALGEVFNNLRTVPIIPVGTKVPVEATFEAVESGAYPLTRVVYWYFNRTPNRPIDPTVLAFLGMVVSPQGQKQLAPMGLVPLPQDVLIMNKKRLQN